MAISDNASTQTTQTNQTTGTTGTTGTTRTNNGDLNSPVTAKAREAAHQAVDAVSTKAASAEDSLRKTAASSQETLAHKQEEIKQQLQSSYSKSCEFIAQHPLAAAGMAFAAGILVSSLLRRR